MRIRGKIWLAGLVLTIVATFAALSVDGIRWRATLLAQKTGGAYDDVPWQELVAMLQPGSGFYLRDLPESGNPYAVIRSPRRSDADIREGESLYRSNCTQCHGSDGVALAGPDILTGALAQGDSDWAIYKTIRDGIPGTAMNAIPLSAAERWRVTAYLAKVRAGRRDIEAAPEVPFTDVSFGRIVAANDEPGNWLTYSRTYDGQRFSPLRGIRRDTVDRLKLDWVIQLESGGRQEASPIVVDGVMFLSIPDAEVRAVDATTGETLWRHVTRVDDNLPICCGRVNRGVALLDDRVFMATLDNRLQAIDAATGKLVWEQRVADAGDGFTITVAPLAIDGKVIVGVSGGEYGIRGLLAAYEADSGELAWRFDTIPGPGEPGHDTWQGEAWRTGGGPTWVTGSYDPELNLVYWGVGNPVARLRRQHPPGRQPLHQLGRRT